LPPKLIGKVPEDNTQLRNQARAVVDGIQLDFKNANKQLKLAIIAELLGKVS